MAEYIEREATIEFIKQNTPHFDGQTTMECVERSIRYAPTSDVAEVKHGEWKCLEQEIGLFACSLCEHRILRAECNYCPNCGAKMDGKGKR